MNRCYALFAALCLAGASAAHAQEVDTIVVDLAVLHKQDFDAAGWSSAAIQLG